MRTTIPEYVSLQPNLVRDCYRTDVDHWCREVDRATSTVKMKKTRKVLWIRSKTRCSTLFTRINE